MTTLVTLVVFRAVIALVTLGVYVVYASTNLLLLGGLGITPVEDIVIGVLVTALAFIVSGWLTVTLMHEAKPMKKKKA